MTLSESFSTQELETLHTSAGCRRLRCSRNHRLITTERSVPIHSNHMVWSPADWTALAAADEFHCFPQCFWASDLRALLLLRLASKLCSATFRTGVRVNWARSHKLGALRVLVEFAARNSCSKLGACLWFPCANCCDKGGDSQCANHGSKIKRASLRSEEHTSELQSPI